MSLPSKPAPRPFGTNGALSTSLIGRADASRLAADSSSSRSSLRQSIIQRRGMLTRQESKFLDELCDNGDEIEVNLAHEKLLDEKLFFKPDDKDIVISNGSEAREISGLSITPEDDLLIQATAQALSRPGMSTRQTSTASMASQGSVRRQTMLESRRNSMLFGKMWKAHENGLAVSGPSSRRSVNMRRTSSVGSTDSLRNLLLFNRADRPDDIFRPSGRHSSPDSKKPDAAGSKSGSRRRSSMKRLSVPRLSRFGSFGSRKSVTFGTLPPSPRKARILKESSFSSLRRAEPIRSDSIASIPSLHQANSVHSLSNSIPSLPAITRAQRVFSDGSIRSLAMSDITSVEGAREERDTSATFEEKKSEDEDMPIPSKVDIPPVVRNDDKRAGSKNPPIANATKLLQHNDTNLGRPVLMREASANVYEGAGMELSDFNELPETKDALGHARQMESLVSSSYGAISRSSSFDESVSAARLDGIFRRTPAVLKRSLSDDDINGSGLDGSRNRALSDGGLSSTKEMSLEEEESWEMQEDDMDYYDSWMVLHDEYENGYGGGGTLGFSILGTSADDHASYPHVLSPPLMESLQAFLPSSKFGLNYWMKYSLVRDGASMHTFLQHARGAKHSVLAIETVEGEVFGAFTGEAWRKNWNYFGNGESFLWRMRHTRKEKSHSIIDQAHMESEIDVYPYTGENTSIQLCTHDMIAVGGGHGDDSCTEKETDGMNHGSPIKKHEWGFGLTIKSEMLTGTTSPCMTFGSPSLSEHHADGSVFEIMNLELWTLTPCGRLEDAEKLELGRLFLSSNRLQ